MNEVAALTRTLTQQDFDRFAELSGDDNPIHVDPGFAENTRFGATVAHGLFLCSILRELASDLVPGGRQISQAAMFPAPTYAGRAIHFRAEIQSRTEDGVALTLKATDTTTDTDTCLIETYFKT